MTTSRTVYALISLTDDEQAHWTDDNDPVQFESFLGVRTTLEGAQALAAEVAESYRKIENELAVENDAPEDAIDEPYELNWGGQVVAMIGTFRHSSWTSADIQLPGQGLGLAFRVFETQLV